MIKNKRTVRWLPSLLLTLVIATNLFADATKPKVQIAVLLDGSGSMQGLIDQAKNQLWKIVNAMADVRKDEQLPTVEIALYEYGKQNLAAEDGFLRQLSSFTGEMDQISELLFDITARGSAEYTGLAIDSAVKELVWSENITDFKAIFIAGNETMEQGPVKIREAIQNAVDAGIIVNTMHAGEESVGERDLWKEAAELGNGQSVNFDMNTTAVHIKTPLDDAILDLNKKLNETYIPFGKHGIAQYERLKKLDKDSGEGLVERGLSKSLGYYRTSSWDLVDALGQESIDLETIKEEDLPEIMRPMTLEEREDYVASKVRDRKLIQSAIREIAKLRKAYVQEELQKIAEEQGATLEAVMIETLRTQLQAKGFELVS